MKRVRPSAGTFARLGQQLAKKSRVILAIKTAAAAALAWYLAPFVPFADAEYAYYAPLGVLVSMYPTVVDSARSGMQALFGLTVGITLGLGALAVVSQGTPPIAALALVVAIGVTLGGLQVFGAGRDWIPISAVFVLVLSGRDASGFSLSYLVTMSFGVLVGVLVQLLVVPPLYLPEARARLFDLQQDLASCLRKVAAAVSGDPEKVDSLGRAVDSLVTTAATVTEEIQEARRSQRANPRDRGRGGERRSLDSQFSSLDQAVLFVRALSELVKLRVANGESVAVQEKGVRLAAMIQQCSALVSLPVDSPNRDELARRACSMLDDYFQIISKTSDSELGTIATDMAAGTCIRCIIQALQ